MPLLEKLPPALATRLRTRVSRQFGRFALVAIASLAASELTLSLALLAHATGGAASLLGWLTGAVVSYVLSRWAWRRKGRPHVLKETLPFWVISVGTAVVLTTTGHLASKFAFHHHLSELQRVAFVGIAYLLMNMITFITRFLIFHFVLFADRGPRDGLPAGLEETESLTAVAVPAVADHDRPQEL